MKLDPHWMLEQSKWPTIKSMALGRTSQELKAALNEQLRALAASCASYDRGDKWEAKRIAVAVYVIVHDGGRNYGSLLTQLNLKQSLKFVASGSVIDGGNILRDTPLVVAHMHKEAADAWAEYVPRCATPFRDAPTRELSFAEWWESDLIFRDTSSFTLTRKELTKNLRDVDGGAHYDPVTKDPNYLQLREEQPSTLKFSFAFASGVSSLPNAILGAELATMRQVAWELIKTFEQLPPEIRTE